MVSFLSCSGSSQLKGGLAHGLGGLATRTAGDGLGLLLAIGRASHSLKEPGKGLDRRASPRTCQNTLENDASLAAPRPESNGEGVDRPAVPTGNHLAASSRPISLSLRMSIDMSKS